MFRGWTRKLLVPPANLVSMRYAPSFRQPPAEDVIGKSVKNIPEDCVTAYVVPDVITESEEQSLMSFVEPMFARLPYNDGHMDGLIHHYKEFYRSFEEVQRAVGSACPGKEEAERLAGVRESLARARSQACHYLPRIPIDDRVHFLRLAGSGFIRSHVDESRNSSGIVAGLCMGSGRVMTLTHPDHPGERVEMLLAPRCMYFLFGRARYTWEHSIDWVADDADDLERIRNPVAVEGTPVAFDGEVTPYLRAARTAIIFRGISPMHLLAQRQSPRCS